jgi:hypothetical protein
VPVSLQLYWGAAFATGALTVLVGQVQAKPGGVVLSMRLSS